MCLNREPEDRTTPVETESQVRPWSGAAEGDEGDGPTKDFLH